MSESQHTPGPWEASSFRTAQARVFNVNAGEVCVARVYEGFPKRAEANASLIAGAPDLLSAAEALMASIDVMDPLQERCSTVAYGDMCEAIRKATGEAD